jgi:hypothetical protein
MTEESIQVSIFHNVTRDENDRPINFFGYEPGMPLVQVFSYQALPDGRSPIDLAEHAFRIGNGHPGKSRADIELSRDYYRRQLRSVSVGDVVVVDHLTLACQPTGWKAVPGDG